VRPGAGAAPLERYGGLPSIEDAALSPDGTRLAFVKTRGEKRYISFRFLGGDKLSGTVGAGEAKIRWLQWANQDKLLITLSATTHPSRYHGDTKVELFQVAVLDVTTRESTKLLDARELRVNAPDQVAKLPPVRHSDGHTVVYVYGFYFDSSFRPMQV
jgi:hypothetical protein